MGRFLVRNALNNKWLDSCNKSMAVRSPDNRTWIPINARKLWMRDSSNNDWIENDCSNSEENAMFNDPCKFGQIQPLNCPEAIDLEDAGSGDGEGSGGLTFDLITGYPFGYDLPDAADNSFTLEKDPSAPKGYSLRRPALNFLFESYDDSGTTPSYGRGNYDNPNYIGSSVFSGGCQITETIFDLRDKEGYVEILFASYDEDGISIDVYYLGKRIATTCGRVRDRSKIEFYWDPVIGEGEQRVMIRVRGSEGTRWTYQVTEPKQLLTIYNLDNTDLSQMAAMFTDEYVGTPIYPAPCHATVFPKEQRTADGKWFYEFHHWIGPISDPNLTWEAVVDFTSWLNADKFEVYHGGLRIATSLNATEGLGMLKLLWRPERFAVPVPDIMVRVTAANRFYEEDIQSWYYSLYCPNTPGYRENPWICGTEESIITGAGHSSTEDVFDLDNGVDPGIVSIAFKGFEEGTNYVVSVFDANYNLITDETIVGIGYVSFMTDSQYHGTDRLRIAVRVDAPLGSSWEYEVSCPAATLDVYIDDKTVPVCNDQVELTITDVAVHKGTMAKFRVSSNIPLPSPLTVSYATENGTATDASEYVGTSGIDVLEDAAEVGKSSFIAYRQANGLLLVDSSFTRIMDTPYKEGSVYNTPIVATTVAQLVPEFRMLVNAINIKTVLTGKRWLILVDRETTSPTDQGLFGNRIQSFLQSMRNVYGVTFDIVPFDLVADSDSWTLALENNYDVITVSTSVHYSEASERSLSAIYLSNLVSEFGVKLNTKFQAGTVIHCVMRVTTNLVLNQRSNMLAQELLNANPSMSMAYDPSKRLVRIAPNPTQYFVTDVLNAYPNSPLMTGIPLDRLIDADFNQAYFTYERLDPTVTPADYVPRSGTLSMLSGDTSGIVEVQTLNPPGYTYGKFFFLNLLSASSGTLIRNRARATIVAKDAALATINFVKAAFASYSYASASGSVLTTYANSITLKVNRSQIADGALPEIVENGKIAYIERNDGSETDARSANRQGICAEYTYDPGKTYTYRWEAVADYNDINAEPTVVGVTETFGANTELTFNVEPPLAVDPVKSLRATYKVMLHIRDSDGNTFSSPELFVSLISAPVL